MADTIPNFEFQHLLAHTFPGFFTALTLFMLIDIWSNKNLTQIIFKDFEGLISFVGFILLIGTILGVVIDGIHHSIIENAIFKNLKWRREIAEWSRQLYPSNRNKFITRHFFLMKYGTDPITITKYLENEYYRYSEFYANTFLSLLLFSLVIPSYAYGFLGISYKRSIILGLASLIIACICLYSSSMSYQRHLKVQFSLICGINNTIPDIVSTPKSKKTNKIEIVTQCTIFFLIYFVVFWNFFWDVGFNWILIINLLLGLATIVILSICLSRCLADEIEPVRDIWIVCEIKKIFNNIALGTLSVFLISLFFIQITSILL